MFLSGDGVVLLGDFGVARALDSSAALAKTQTGTPFYMAPEVGRATAACEYLGSTSWSHCT